MDERGATANFSGSNGWVFVCECLVLTSQPLTALPLCRSVHGLMAFGTDAGIVECWDTRINKRVGLTVLLPAPSPVALPAARKLNTDALLSRMWERLRAQRGTKLGRISR